VRPGYQAAAALLDKIPPEGPGKLGAILSEASAAIPSGTRPLPSSRPPEEVHIEDVSGAQLMEARWLRYCVLCRPRHHA
jgi:hypothetical protein